jgi:DNA-directed RNA polymerase subunit M/transcription elongation factor TFIIS
MKRSDYEKLETLAMEGESFNGFFACESCGSKKTGFIQLQIERADEPMTNFVFCYDCEKRYKC